MEGFNWSNSNSTDFTYFCNALLSMELGKQFQPFSAPGKDKGIDGYYYGGYDSKKGHWRFQYKFHQEPRKQGFHLLKADIKNETNKIKDEDFFVLLTNVELLPQEVKSLNEIYEQNISASTKQAHFEIWDGAKLFTLFIQYPILALWLNEGFETAQLQDYRTAFKSGLENSIEEASTLTNFFVARESDIERLTTFLNGQHVMALVTGEAGIGKTRLILEFFNKVVSQMEEWDTLVLLNRSVDFDKIKKALSGKRKSIILVDDAHTFSPEVIADIKSVTDLMKGSVKLILTSRSLEAYTSLKLIKEYEQEKITRLQLSELSRVETKKLFQHELKNHSYYNYIDELTQISHGKPILIVALLRAIKNGTHISKVREENFLSLYVRNYFDSYIALVIQETASSKIQVSKLLQLICLIEPFNYSDIGIVTKLASACNIQSDAVLFALKKLQENGISSGRYEQSIRPDYYSDILLMGADPQTLVQHLPDFMEFLNNIITNLSSVDEVKEEKGSLLDLLLDMYTNAINESDNLEYISKIFSTVASITFLKPVIAAKTVNSYFTALDAFGSPIALDFSKYLNYYYQSPESIHGRIKSILFDLLYHKDYYEFVVNATFKLYKLSKDEKTASAILHFAKRDYLDHFKLARQTYFVEHCRNRLSAMDAEELLFAIQCCKLLLQLDFTVSSWDRSSRNTMTMTTFYLQESASINKFRKNVILLLVEIFSSSTDPKVKLAALEELIDLPRGIFASKRNPTPYSGDAEIDSILDFLITIAADLPPSAQKEVLDKIFWYRKWGISEKFNEKLGRISQLLMPRNLTEELVHLFARSENLLSTQAEEKMVERSRQIIGSANPHDLALSIIDLCKEDLNKFYFLWSFLSVLHREFPDQSKIVYTTLWENNKSLVYHFGAPFLQELSFKHKQKEFYWNSVQLLQSESNGDADNVLLRVYSHYPFADDAIQDNDIEIIKAISAKKNVVNNFDLARALLTVLRFNEEVGKILSVEFLGRCSQREADIFFIFLGENNKAGYETTKMLTLEHSILFSITYEIERCLNRIVQAEGVKPIVSYFLKRFAIKKQIVHEKKTLLDYDWVPSGGHSHLFEGCEEQEKFEFFYAIVNWYINEPLDNIEAFFAKDILDYAIPVKYLTGDVLLFFETLIDTSLSDPIKVQRILEALEAFHDKEENLANLIIGIYSKAYSKYNSEEEIFKEIRYKCYAALTTMGVKSGTAGEPFQVDLDLKNLLEFKLKELQEYAPAHKFLYDVIKSVNKDIQSQYERDNELW